MIRLPGADYIAGMFGCSGALVTGPLGMTVDFLSFGGALTSILKYKLVFVVYLQDVPNELISYYTT